MKNIFFAATVLATLISCAWAETPTASHIEQEQKRIEAQRKQIFDAKNPAANVRPAPLPGQSSIEREMQNIERERKAMFDQNNPATKNAPNMFPNIPTPPASNVDIEALAKRYEQRAQARKMDDLMIFASFTMPQESLKRIVAQANKVGASVILRGFKGNSLKATALAIKDLGETNGNVLVNPNAFTKYKVKAVPVVVLAKADSIDQIDNQGCALPDTYVSVAGDVSLDYALDEISRRDPRFVTLANRYNRQLKGRL